MKIGIVIHHFDPHRGGAEFWTWQFTQHALAAGHEVHVIAQSFTLLTQQMGIVPHRLLGARSRLAFAEAAEFHLRKLSLDVVHDMGCGWHFDVMQPHDGSRTAQFEQKLLGMPRWMRPIKRTVARLLPRYRQIDALQQRQFGDRNRLIIALSKMVARDLVRCHDWPKERIRLIYNGVDLERFSPAHRDEHRGPTRSQLGVQAGEVLLLFVGHDFQRKGLPTLLTAMSQLVNQGLPVRLAVLGGKKFGPYRRMTRRLGVEAAVTFVGSVKDPVPYYAAADVYAMPTLYDPCSLGVLEALASGLPVVTSGNNGAGELVNEGVEGYIVADPADHRQLAERLTALCNAERRTRMSGAARVLAMKHSLARNCQQVLALYDEIEAGRRRRAA